MQLKRSLAQLILIVEHGIKMTGMPAFGPSHSRDELESIAAFVDTLPRLTVTEYKEFIGTLSVEQPDTVQSPPLPEGNRSREYL